MDYLPLFINLKDTRVVVIGGGAVAARKISLLLAAGAMIQVAAPKVCAELSSLAIKGSITLTIAEFMPGIIENARLVIAATDDEDCNAAVAKAAKQVGILVNVVDNVALSNCILPAIVDRSPVIVAVSSGGTAPLLTTELRAQIETLLPDTLGSLATFIGRHRAALKAAVRNATARRRLWQTVLRGGLSTQILRGETQDAEDAFSRLIANATTSPCSVHLVNICEPTPDALTVRAVRSLYGADVIFADQDIDNQVLNVGRREASRHRLPRAISAFDFQQSRLASFSESLRAQHAVVYLANHHPAWVDLLGSELRARGVLTQVGT